MILVADDHKDTCGVIRGLLRSEGLATACVHSGRDALDAMKTTVPDMLVLDMMMPGMSGLEVLRAVRANPATASLPVLVYTASMNEGELDEVGRLGAQILVKGVADWGNFASTIRAHLDQRTIKEEMKDQCSC